MSLRKEVFHIGGMTCVNCQKRIAQKLRSTAGVKTATVSYQKETAEITYDTDVISQKQIAAIIESLDYRVIWEKKPAQDVLRAAAVLAVIVFLYILLQRFGILNLLVPSQLADTGMGYGMLFLVGLLTSVHCIAMCGGINLSQCIPKGETSSGKQSGFSAFCPAVLYNLGRVISYTVIGFVLGLIGTILGGGSGAGLSIFFQGILKLIAGIFMVVMGINMLGLFPSLRKIRLALPKSLAGKLNRQKLAGSGPLIVGLLNGLMPCGPLQSMQIVALASGNPFSGALSMLLFSLGTVPLMLGLGSIVSALGKRFTQKVMSIGAVLVVVLGLAMLSQGGSLSGLLPPERLLPIVILLSILGVVSLLPYRKPAYKAVSLVAVCAVLIGARIAWANYCTNKQEPVFSTSAATAQMDDGVQVVTTTLASGSYPDIVVQAGVPVRWIMDAPEGSINGCNYQIVIGAYDITYSFRQGENVIEFTPTEAGSVSYSCWMGMIHGTIYVTDENGDLTETEPALPKTGGSCCG